MLSTALRPAEPTTKQMTTQRQPFTSYEVIDFLTTRKNSDQLVFLHWMSYESKPNVAQKPNAFSLNTNAALETRQQFIQYHDHSTTKLQLWNTPREDLSP